MNQNYELVIGLEVHAELDTNTKIFCGCKNEFGALENSLCCPVCSGMPGTLPLLNEKVVDYGIMMGHALNCEINGVTKQDRKNYFYPDLPKAYQISQAETPLCQNGWLDVYADGEITRVRINRIHIEEDAGKLTHDEEHDGTLADYNRGGVPLIEIVSEPDMRSADQAKAFMESITNILLYLGISQAKMQEGNVRADVNVSIRPIGQQEYGIRTEMKNVNSFNNVHRAIVYESARQIELLKAGKEVQQETRRWDDAKGKSILMRSKEDAEDYRYFPDPDQLTYVITPEKIRQLKEAIPELPLAKAQRYKQELGLSDYDAHLIADNKQRADFFDKAISLNHCEAKAVANWLLGDVLKMLNEQKLELSGTKLTPQNLSSMIGMIEKGTISNTAGKTVLEVILQQDVTPEQVVQDKGLAQISDSSALNTIVQGVLGANPKAVSDYKSGKTNVLGFLVGQCMKASKGQGNPAILKELVEQSIQEL